MAVFENFYSGLVRWLKLLLPLAALGLLSTMFLFDTGPRDRDAIPFAEIEELAREQAISEPYFAGVADDGSLVTVSARSARPDGAGGLRVDALRAEVNATDGSRVTLSAGSGAILDSGRTARLDGLVRVSTSTGYEIETTGVTAGLDTGRVETIGPLAAHAPFGELTAGGLVIDSGEAGAQLTFTGGVRLVYRPQERER